jgi:hypothetical protein
MSERIHKIEGKERDDEDWLQHYIAKHLEILPLRDIDGIECKTKFIGREFISTDILLLDERGLMTIVEVKTPEDARSRRSVLAQIFDYAAQLAKQDANDLCRALSESIPKGPNEDFPDLLKTYQEIANAYQRDINDYKPKEKYHPGLMRLAKYILGSNRDKDIILWCDRFVRMIDEGSFRLVIVIKEVSQPLVELTNYLSSSLSRGLQLAVVELSPITIGGERYFVPHLVGANGSLSPVYYREEKTAERQYWEWDENSFFDEAKKNLNSKELEAVKKLYEFSCQRCGKENIRWGKGENGSFTPRFDWIPKYETSYNIYLDGYLRTWNKKLLRELEEQNLVSKPGLDAWIPKEEWVPKVDKIISTIDKWISEHETR